MAVNKSIPTTSQFSSAVPGSSFSQRTFLGSSMSKFSLSAGFGDSASSLGVNLIDDPINTADLTTKGDGQDPYHNSADGDKFAPPPVGSPVFFAMGPTYPLDTRRPLPTTEDSFRKTMDDLFGYQTTQPGQLGYLDLAFGGLLQTYNQTRGSDGNPVYSVQVVDPREVLSNVELLLRDYAGTTMGSQNMFNLYGFLEFNGVAIDLDGYDEDLLKRTDSDNGQFEYTGTDMRYYGIPKPTYEESLQWGGEENGLPTKFPITGTGLSRVGPQGIPYYRLVQAINALGGLYGRLPSEYEDAGFGGVINFRGFNYVVDLSAVPIISQFYYFDYDKINLLDFCQEVCEITSSELFVSLLPIIDHPATENLHAYNEAQKDPSQMIHGMIKINTVNRTASQQPNAIKNYIDTQLDGKASRTDVGVELSNVVTDKFIVGGQEVENILLPARGDRLPEDETGNSWKLKYSLTQQVLPYYGLLKSGAATIPKGFGAYQQILLDAADLNLKGVGDYYVTTEMELRAAIISFDSWASFLNDYNELYMESTEDNDLIEGAALERTPNVEGINGVKLSKNYAVAVPRCLWPKEDNEFGDNDLPVDVCHPPYGYPLYYKRASGIGLSQGGFAGMNQSFLNITSSIANISNATTQKEFISVLRSTWQEYKDASKDWNQDTTTAEKEYFQVLDNAVEQVLADPAAVKKADVIGLLQRFGSKLTKPQTISQKAAQKGMANAQRVYKFLKDIATKHLGKTFLVKIPRAVNWQYANKIDDDEDGNVSYGPFGFKPRTINNDPRETMTLDSKPQDYDTYEREDGTKVDFLGSQAGRRYLQVKSTSTVAAGALVTNHNPITNELVSNYKPNSSGGYWDSKLMVRDADKLTKLQTQALAPMDEASVFKDNNRVSCYVRFDNSQNISFDKMSRDKFTQQTIKGDMWVQDANYALDNVTNGSNLNLTPEDPAEKGSTQCAFVKCTVASKFVFAPAMEENIYDIYGQDVVDIARWSEPKRIFNCETGKVETSIPYLVSDLRPTSLTYNDDDIMHIKDGTSKTDLTLLDTASTYAVITLPARIEPTVDARLRDGAGQAFNTWRVKHACNQDVVRGVTGFDEPGFVDKKQDIQGEFDTDPLPLTTQRAIAKAKDGLTYGKASIAYASPSPVYPDLVCLPLESSERCYGPWSSSLMNGSFQNIGGDIVYSKNENLAPWNYSGFDLMNQAGYVQAQNSNSLLLQSERGSFSIPAAPQGIALASFLGGSGPLVTNINVSIGMAGVETSYVMDMYTSSFGKLQKQKSDNIAKIGRLKQQQEDKKNLDLRRDVRKSQIDNNRQETEEMIRDFSVEDGGVELSPGFEVKDNSVNTTVLTVQEREEAAALIEDDTSGTEQSVDSVYRSYTTSGSSVNGSNAGDTASLMPSDNQARDFGNSADQNIQDNQVATATPQGKGMAGTGNKAQSMDDLYDDDIEPTSAWG